MKRLQFKVMVFLGPETKGIDTKELVPFQELFWSHSFPHSSAASSMKAHPTFLSDGESGFSHGVMCSFSRGLAPPKILTVQDFASSPWHLLLTSSSLQSVCLLLMV